MFDLCSFASILSECYDISTTILTTPKVPTTMLGSIPQLNTKPFLVSGAANVIGTGDPPPVIRSTLLLVCIALMAFDVIEMYRWPQHTATTVSLRSSS